MSDTVYVIKHYRFEEFFSVLKSYDHVAVGITKIDKSIMGMIVNGAEIHAIDGKQFNMLKVYTYIYTCLFAYLVLLTFADWIGLC